MSFSYANPTSGPSAGGIGWFNFGNLTLSPGQTIPGLTGTLNDGTTVTFDLSAPANSSMIFDAYAAPVYGNFGNTGYTGILGNVVLQSRRIFNYNPAVINLSNIVVKDPFGNPVTNYTTILADSEETNIGESWTWTTDGGVWNQFALLGSNPPTLTGLGTQTATIAGLDQSVLAGNYLLSTLAPKNLSMTLISNGGLEAVSIGFSVTKITVEKNVGQRIDPADQFVLNIGGNPNAQVTTTGSADGLQTETAVIYAFPGNTYTINEAMAPGSGSTLSQYTVITSAANATPAGSIPPTGALPVSFTPALGDDVTYTILNAAPETFSKTVDKAYADIGDVLTYTITVNNPNNFTINNVLVTDAAPAGTTYLGNLIVSAPFTGTNPASGITITSIGPDDVVTISYQVKVNSTPPVPTPIPNVAAVVVPDGTSGSTNVVLTHIAHAFVSALKSVDKAYANVGDTLTYTVVLTNSGNAAANNVVLTDPVPAGTAYVAGSVTGTVPFTGTPATGLTLTAPIPAGGSAAITYKVLVGSTVPTINPIPNTAGAAYAYTVDPAKPNGVKASATSNTVTTLISSAALTTRKTGDKAIAYVGDVITYSIAVTNTGNVAASNVVLTDPVPVGTTYVPGSLTASAPFTGSPLTTIQMTNPIAPGQTVTLTYKVTVTMVPNPNPIANTVTAAFTYTVNPRDPDGAAGTSVSNTVNTVVFMNNYSQQISDLIQSIALEEAAIGNIANAEGAKIQKILAQNATPNQLLCVNKSVSDMMDALNTLESVLKQKLNTVDCQISPSCMP